MNIQRGGGGGGCKLGPSYLQKQTLRSNSNTQYSIKCKRENTPDLKLQLITQQPETSCQSYCCALISEENREGGGECLHAGAFWPLGLHCAVNHFAWASKVLFLLWEEGSLFACLGEQEENRLLPKVRKSCMRKKHFMPCVDSAWVSFKVTDRNNTAHNAVEKKK